MATSVDRIAFQRDGDCYGHMWRQLHLIEKDQITHIDLEPALMAGYRVVKVRYSPTPDDWPDMSIASIRSWILANWNDPIEIDPTEVDTVLARYRERSVGQ
ncbi:MAG: hypothetical protein UY96_C0003G0083 [Parcubacteria group bacterium GW2011_GWB1_56_8]|nr:MAG: hypothetical protein UY96_C0003G0083 [Parcubacteria group bacterium GW2011_GWB1_56_8]